MDGKTTTTAWDEACVELAKSVPVSGQKLGKGGKTVAMNKNLVASLVRPRPRPPRTLNPRLR